MTPDPTQTPAGPVPLLDIQHLSIGGDRAAGIVDRASLCIARGEIQALVGESGSGKSVTALAILGLLPAGLRVTGGSIGFDGQDLARLPEPDMRRLRGRRIGMVFQEPMAAMNPMLSIAGHVGESLRLHRGLSRRQARQEAIALLDRVGIPAPAERADDYPHQLSGGMRQRVMIAAALACGPDLLIADEPTTALDVTIQAQILDLLARLGQDLGMALLLITHDLGIVAQYADRVAVMYAGHVVERMPAQHMMSAAAHPYTTALIGCVPAEGEAGRLADIPGSVPQPGRQPTGCRFHPRCTVAMAACSQTVPEARPVGTGHDAACLRVAA